MKQTYIQPQLSVIEVAVSLLIADSPLGVDSREVNDSGRIGFVKGESRPSNHSVWDDDWSKE